MITKNTYYKNNIYIPHAKPSITSDVTTVSAELDDFIDKYERKCLIKCLGLELFILFAEELDNTKPNGLKDTSDVKWDYLLNGRIYNNPSGELVEWRGIRYKAKSSDTEASVSFLANYVYINYESNFDGFRTGIGVVEGKAKNAERMSPAKKVTDAWREMVEMIQGKTISGTYLSTPNGIGVDWFDEDQELSLYNYIEDSNKLVEDYYPNFKKGYWQEGINQFGI